MRLLFRAIGNHLAVDTLTDKQQADQFFVVVISLASFAPWTLRLRDMVLSSPLPIGALCRWRGVRRQSFANSTASRVL